MKFDPWHPWSLTAVADAEVESLPGGGVHLLDGEGFGAVLPAPLPGFPSGGQVETLPSASKTPLFPPLPPSPPTIPLSNFHHGEQKQHLHSCHVLPLHLSSALRHSWCRPRSSPPRPSPPQTNPNHSLHQPTRHRPALVVEPRYSSPRWNAIHVGGLPSCLCDSIGCSQVGRPPQYPPHCPCRYQPSRCFRQQTSLGGGFLRWWRDVTPPNSSWHHGSFKNETGSLSERTKFFQSRKLFRA